MRNKFIATAFIFFILGYWIAPNPSTKIVVEDKWSELKNIDDKLFLIDDEAFNLAAEGFLACSQGDARTMQRINNELDDILYRKIIAANDREKFLNELSKNE